MKKYLFACVLACGIAHAGGVNNPAVSATPSGACGGDLGGSYPNCTVTGQHFSAALPVANGGTGATTSTGSGSVVLSTSPTLTTPVLGVAAATSVNKLTLTAPATGSTLTIADGKTLTISNTITLAGTDGSTLNIGAGGALGTAATANTGASGHTVPYQDGANTWSGVQTLSTPLAIASGGTASATAAAALTALGAQAAGGLYTNQVLLTATSGNWTVPAGVTQIRLLMQGGGAGGGGTGGTTASSATAGTSGVWLSATYATTPGASIAYTVGASAAGGSAGANNGTTGNSTTFGTLTANGGSAGVGSASGNATGITAAAFQALRSTTAPIVGAVIEFTQVNSVIAAASTGTGGSGGFAPWGVPGVGATATANGGAATGYGAGGGGGSNATAGAATSGGAGAPGLIVIMY